jgi:hypothetical protein
MKTSYVIIITLMLGASLSAQASDKEEKPTPEPQLSVGQTPAMSEIPTMKQQGERMAVLMQQLSKESNPEIRRRIMAEAMCPQ